MNEIYIVIGGRRNSGRIIAVEYRIHQLRRKLDALRLMEAAGVISPGIYQRGGLAGVRSEIAYYEGELHALEEYLRKLKA